MNAMVCSHRLVVIVLALSLAGCGREHAEATRKPSIPPLSENPSVTLFRVVPRLAEGGTPRDENHFAGHRVEERATLSPDAARELVGLLNDQTVYTAGDVPMCFAPRIGVRMQTRSGTTDILLWLDGHTMRFADWTTRPLSASGRERLAKFFEDRFPSRAVADQSMSAGPCG